MRTLLLILLTSLCYYARAEVYAVLVGINTYDCTLNDLNLAVRDTQSIYNLLQEKTLSENIVLLTDGQATRNSFITRTNEIFTNTMERDIVSFYCSGYGMSGYFCTYDVQGGQRGLSHNDVKQAFKHSRAGTKLCITDACFSGSIRGKKKHASISKPCYHKSNVVFIMSSRSNEISVEQNNANGLGRRGYLLYVLLALRGRGGQEPRPLY